MSEKERLYIWLLQYGFAKDCEFEYRLKDLQRRICLKDVSVDDFVKYIMLIAEIESFNCWRDDIIKILRD